MKVEVGLELDARPLPADADTLLTPRIAAVCGVPEKDVLSYVIRKRSLDARKKPLVKILYQITAVLRDGVTPRHPVTQAGEPLPEWNVPDNRNRLRNPLVVGTGPAGLFAALVLAEAGADPIILDCGRDVTRRKQDIDRFFQTRELNPQSNLLFGEGGAGTWSDGKLYTRVRDERIRYVLNAFARAGAPHEILYYSHPHIGSDRLPEVIAAIRNRILALGGKFLWDTEVVSVKGDHDSFQKLILSTGETLEGPAAIIACGHSARELILSLSKLVQTSLKGFQIGCRVEHPQNFINKNQYGTETPSPALGAAEYLFSSRGNGNIQGATTFCMCPGGEIIPAVCRHNTLSTNGMSKAARDGKFANSAIISTISPEMFSCAEEAVFFLNTLETNVFRAGGENYTAPAQTIRDFLERKQGNLPAESSYRLGLKPERLDLLLPAPIRSALDGAMRHFEKLAPGFLRLGTLIGMETKVSSPIRFQRNPETLESSMNGLYIGGEGGGMAGGIVSAALDGVKLAEALLKRQG